MSNTEISNIDGTWWQSGTVYQVYPRSFRDSNGDGIGDLGGLLEKIDYLHWLGVDAVWLSPVYRSPQHDNGYDISDYQDIDPTFGTLAQLDEVIETLRERGMRLIMDLVVNHTSTEHAWFTESRSSRQSAKRDWYIWRSPREGFTAGEPGAEPTNWESFFSRPAWTLDEATGEYYLHLFAPEQPDLNWENPEVRQAVYSMMNWWLDRGVGGFRMDVINLISKVYPFGDGPPLADTGRGDGREWYQHGPRLHEFLREMQDEVFAGRDAGLVRVGETPDVTVDQARELSDPGQRMLDMVFQFEHVSLDREPDDWKRPVPMDREAIYRNLADWQSGLAERGWNSLYWTNHDQPRTVSRFGDDSPQHWEQSAKTLATVLYLMKGTAFVYQGDEIGMVNMSFAGMDDFVDVSAIEYIRAGLARGRDPLELVSDLSRTSRDNARTPMQWTSEPTAGFTSGTPWFAVNASATWLSVQAQRDDPQSVLSHVRAVIAARRQLKALAEGDFVELSTGDARVVAYDRDDAVNRVRVVANLSSDSVAVDRALVEPGVDPGMAGVEALSVGETSAGLIGPWASRVWTTDV
ncbi:MAG: alpha-glucosidase [Kineosporiaceae bacterium]|nr:alpha-glucosidase [Aeromicrobium sp.]